MARGRGDRPPLAELAKVVTRFPQVLINVRVGDKAAVASSRWCWRRSRRPRRNSASPAGCCCGPSGTEPLVRVMVEAGTTEQAQGIAERVAEVVGRRLTGPDGLGGSAVAGRARMAIDREARCAAARATRSVPAP